MYVVTGGTGFIGSNIVAGLENETEEDIVIIDSFTIPEKWKNIHKRKRIANIISPSEAKPFLQENKNKIKALIHMGEMGKNESINELIENNFKFGIYLWDFCTENDIPFIYSSSFRTYGCDAEYFSDTFTEEALSLLKPKNPYSWTKHIFDLYVARSVLKKNKSPSQWVGLKFFSVYGPNEYHKESGQSLVAQAYPHAAKEKSFTLFKSENDNYKDGEQMRDFVYVNDCVDVVLWFLKNKNVNGLYNVGTGTPRTFYDVAISVYKSIGIEPKIKYDDMPSELLSKYQYFAQADIKSLRNAGYTKPFTSLEDGVRDYVINYLHTSDPYK